MNQLADRIAGGLAGALLGDAMGSVTEMLTPRQIAHRYGRVATLLAPADGTFADGRTAGQLTDDGLLTLAILEALQRYGGRATPRRTADLLLEWAADPEVFRRFAGPSSRRAILALREGATPEEAGAPDPMANDLRISNGAAMKVAPAGWFHPGDLPDAVETAGALCVPTHNSHIAFAGAGCVAAAASIAASGGNISDILNAAIVGAERGCQLGLQLAFEVPAPSMAARVGLAIDIADDDASSERRIARLAELIGPGLPITEAVPMAVGLVGVLGDDPMELIRTTVNLGSDADTVASIAAAIAGTRTGLAAFDPEMVTQLEQANGIDIAAIGASAAASVTTTNQEAHPHGQ